MKIDDLGAALREACESAPEKQKVVSIHLFGIRHAKDLASISPARVIAASGLKATYATELRKGANLAPFVNIRS